MKSLFSSSLLAAALAGTTGLAAAQTPASFVFKKPVSDLDVKPATVPRLELSASSLAFDQVLLGASRSETVLVLNTGLAPLTGIRDVRTSGAGYSVQTSCGQTLAAGASCPVTVTFTPAQAIGYSGSLSFLTDLADARVTVPLAGTGLSLTGTLVSNSGTNFGLVTLGEYADLEFAFSNTGSIAYTNLRPQLSGTGLSLLASSCGTPAEPVTLSNLDGQNTCTMTLRYAPSALGTLTGSLQLVSQQFNSNTLALSGAVSVIDSQLAAVSSTAFGSVNLNASVARQFTYSNTGTVSLSGVQAVVSGHGMSLSANTCGTAAAPVPLAAGASCSMTVTFTPTEGGAVQNAALTVQSAQTPARSLALTATGNAPRLQWENATTNEVITSWQAGSTAAGGGGTSVSLRVRNTGTTNLSFTGAPFAWNTAQPFYVNSTTCASVSLAPNATCTLTVLYAPSSTGTVNRVLSANTNQTGAQTLAVAGTATSASATTLLLIDGEGGTNVFNNRMNNGITLERSGTGVTTNTSIRRYGSASIRFDGTASLNTSNDARLDIGTADFTLEWWGYRSSASAPNFGMHHSPVATGDFYVFHDVPGYYAPGTGYCVFGHPGMSNCFTYWAMMATGTTIGTGSWRHFAITRQGSTYRMFVNGTQVATYDPGFVFSIGAAANNAWSFGTYSYNGYLDDIRFVKGQALYTANFTPPGAL